MTMVPAPEIDTNLSSLLHQQHHQLLVFLQGGGVLYGGGYAFLDHNTNMINRVHGYEYQTTNCVGSDLASSNPMAEDESRTNSLNDAVSTSKENNNNTNNSNDDSWLTLGLGSHVVPAATTVRHDEAQYSEPATERHRRPPGELIELDLLPGSGSSRAPPPPQLPLGSIFHMPEFRPPSRPVLHSFGSSNLFFQHQLQQAAGSSSTASFPHHHHHHHHYPHQDVGWSFSPVKDKNIAAVGSPSPSSSNLPFGSYFARPFHVQDVAGPPSSDFRVVDPPRRPHSGIWFFLQASQNQVKEPALPQIPKSYLRIKDGRMTVRLLIKYLANKLRVDSESEIEIRCRGQELEPFLTLQHVRDNIWSPSSRDAPPITLLPHPASSSTADHLMVLHYARTPT